MLFIIDMQNDFVDQNNGLMVVKDAHKLVDGILKKIREYEENGDIIFYTLNIHRNMPDNNRSEEVIEWGQDLYPPLKDALKDHIPLKKSYYSIPHRTLKLMAEKYKDEEKYVSRIEFVGVETNICVLTNAIIIQNIFPDAQIIINENLCISNNLRLHKDTLNVMKGLNMEVIKNEIK